MTLIRRFTALLTQLFMIQFAILSGSGVCPMADGSRAAEVAAMSTSPAATAGAPDGAPAGRTESAGSPHESGRPDAPHHHDGHHPSSHCTQSCVPGACASAHCATVAAKERASLALEMADRVSIPAGREGVPAWFATAPEPPPPRA